MPDIKVGTVYIMYTDAKIWQAFILAPNQALTFGKKIHKYLVTPTQMQVGRVIVSDIPIQFDSNSTRTIIGNIDYGGDHIIFHLKLREMVS